MDDRERQELIKQYGDGYQAVAEALLKITPGELDASPGPGRWTVRQIVHHLADSEMTAAIRLRLLLGSDHPVIHAYDQDRFAERLHYDRPHEASLDAFRAAREATVDLLARLTPAEWLREGTHTESGRYDVETWLKIYSQHAHRHARQIREARGAGRT